jgi:predicted O-linked N-acetylglucosamine transferase (SPINDLY family)
VTIQQSFDLAVQHHQSGRLREAESLYRQVLAQYPNHADALHLLGVIALQSSQYPAAADLIARAIALRPTEAPYHNNQGNAWMSLGKLDAAAASFRQALALRPSYAEAHYNLGLVFQKQELAPDAIAEYRTALQLKPDYPDAWQNLGILSLKQKNPDAAISAFREVLRFRPVDPEIHYELGNALLDQTVFLDAVAAYQEAIRLRPDYAEAHYNLGIALHGLGQIEAAKAAYRAALQIKPDHAAARGNLGKALLDEGQLDAAIVAFQSTLQIRPDHADTYYNLGNALQRKEQRTAAEQSYRAALRCNPRHPDAWGNLGNLLQESDQFDEAIAAYQNALAARPDYANAYNNLGSAFRGCARSEEALAMYRRAVALEPLNPDYHSNLVYHLLFHPAFSPQEIRQELARWNERHAAPLRSAIRPFSNPPDPSRRLKIGYVSTDLRDHVIGRNLLPLFRHHDRSQFEIVCYASLLFPDAITREFQKHSDLWRNTVRTSDEALAEQIRQDGIDILVELGLHLAQNRLLVFARQPAPVQVTFAGYPGSTGVETIRYRLTDPFLDPPDRNDTFHSEESIRLPATFWCFDPLEEILDVNELPALRDGCVTFGCLNNFCKINDPVLTLWARVLAEVPGSRFRLLAPRGRCREAFLGAVEAKGVDLSRVEFMTKAPRSEYLTWYHGIDLVLDTFPYNGHTTSLDALWMGVPVVSLAGEHPVSRAGLSQMSNLGLPELVTSSPDEYVRIAVQLARDIPRLTELRRTLRPRMQASPLMDASTFARNIESAYRGMWQHWCENQSESSIP